MTPTAAESQRGKKRLVGWKERERESDETEEEIWLQKVMKKSGREGVMKNRLFKRERETEQSCHRAVLLGNWPAPL